MEVECVLEGRSRNCQTARLPLSLFLGGPLFLSVRERVLSSLMTEWPSVSEFHRESSSMLWNCRLPPWCVAPERIQETHGRTYK